MLEEEKKGHLQPINQIIYQVSDIFRRVGFTVALGPEVETEYYNFDALNIPKDHPARDIQDTFWLKPMEDRKLLRTHTSPVQVRFMEQNKPPFKVLVPGRVFRNEATDATHEAQFHQVEGLVVGEDISLSDLKGTLEFFLQELFGSETKLRFRPGFFPFVEPGLEVDVSCFKCGGEGCNICKQTGWIEVLGAGMVHPNVLKSGGIDSDKWQGFAFGVGIDRLVMIRHGVEDIRLLYGGDIRFVNQF